MKGLELAAVIKKWAQKNEVSDTYFKSTFLDEFLEDLEEQE